MPCTLSYGKQPKLRMPFAVTGTTTHLLPELLLLLLAVAAGALQRIHLRERGQRSARQRRPGAAVRHFLLLTPGADAPYFNTCVTSRHAPLFFAGPKPTLAHLHVGLPGRQLPGAALAHALPLRLHELEQLLGGVKVGLQRRRALRLELRLLLQRVGLGALGPELVLQVRDALGCLGVPAGKGAGGSGRKGGGCERLRSTRRILTAGLPLSIGATKLVCKQ
jgi:hypothetical protein